MLNMVSEITIQYTTTNVPNSPPIPILKKAENYKKEMSLLKLILYS
jgi:hypothetical protein